MKSNLIQPGASISMEQLLQLLNESEKQVAAGEIIPAQDVVTYIKFNQKIKDWTTHSPQQNKKL